MVSIRWLIASYTRFLMKSFTRYKSMYCIYISSFNVLNNLNNLKKDQTRRSTQNNF